MGIKLGGLYGSALTIFIAFSQIKKLHFLFCIKMVELWLDRFI